MHSLCGLLDADFRAPSLDYEDLIKASQVLCESPAVGQSQFVRAVFNLFAANQDDHTKNWAFLQDDAGVWRPSPAYDRDVQPEPVRRARHGVPRPWCCTVPEGDAAIGRSSEFRDLGASA